MKAQELRIGNYVKLFLNHQDYDVIEIKIDDLYYINQKNGIYEPIQLTEEWLLKFGFEKLTDSKDGFKTTSYTYTKGISFIVYFDGVRLSTNFWIGNEKHYVHQLQNLFFALTGEELKLI